MAVRIRMTRMGAKKRPFYRLVAADSEAPRDGKFLEILGYYDPMKDPAVVKIHEDKMNYWIDPVFRRRYCLRVVFLAPWA